MIEFFGIYEYNGFIRLAVMLILQGGNQNSMTIEVGSVMEGTVTGITKFGAFVELPDKKVGLVHISEVANEYVKDVNDFLKVRDKVNVKVLSVDDKGKSPCLSNRPSRRRKRKNSVRNAIFGRNMNSASITALIRAVRRARCLLKTGSANS